MNYEELMPKLRGIIPRERLKFSCEDKSLLYELIDPKKKAIRDIVEQSSNRNYSAYVSKNNPRSICSFAKEILEGCSPSAFTSFLYEVDNEDTGENGEIEIKLAARFGSDFAEITENNANEVIGRVFYSAIKEASERKIHKKKIPTQFAEYQATGSQDESGTNVSTNKLNDPDTLDLFDRIESHKKLYVETEGYKSSLATLLKTKRLLIVGNPGAGKSFTSEMIVNRFAENGYRVRFSNHTWNVKSIISELCNHPGEKELVFIDDCLGQAYMTLNSDQESELKRLLVLMKRMSNKYLLLNSRIAILNKVIEHDQPIGEPLKELYREGAVIRIDSLSELERATILYKHLLIMNGITNEHFKSLQSNSRYFNIIDHRNYNPRLIWHVTQDFFLEGKDPKEYYKDVLYLLNHPKMLWANEYNDRLVLRDRLLLTTLYSLTDASCGFEECRIAYESRLRREQSIDRTIDNWSAALSILNGSFVSIGKEGNSKRTIGVINPSVNDYLAEGIMKKDSPECEKQKESIVYAVQIPRLFQDEYESAFINLLKNHAILNLTFESEKVKNAYITYLVGKSKLIDPLYKEIVNSFIQEGCPEFFLKQSMDAVAVFSELVRHKEVTDYYLPGIDTTVFFSSFFHKFGTGIENLCRFVDSVTNNNPLFVRFISPESIDSFCDVLDEMIECEYRYDADYVYDVISDNPNDSVGDLNGIVVSKIQDDMEELVDGDYFPNFRIPKMIGKVIKEHLRSSWYDYSDEIERELSSREEVDPEQLAFWEKRNEYISDRIKIIKMFEKGDLK